MIFHFEVLTGNTACRYVHMVEPRVNAAMGGAQGRDATDSLAPFRAIWRNTFISAGGHDQVRRGKP